MKIDIWSDFACPFCYIGKRRFEEALEQFAHADGVRTVFRSFQLDPQASVHPSGDIHDMLAAKYGMPRAQAKAMNDQVTGQAAELGLHYDFDRVKPTNTLDAHRLAHYAASQGKGDEAAERLLKAYFIDGVNIGEHSVLTAVAEELGLSVEEVEQVLSSDKYAQDVHQDIEQGVQLGLTGVPFFVFDNKYAVSGAQPSSLFLEVLNKVWEENQTVQPLPVIKTNGSAQGGECTDDSCTI
ncbi:DsbA family oxidoreductase [Paenibacillus sp. JX-17]|uniref:DsbA family oxidoreductase n=1 Tax=Paenibacillus lacisoli TaxID=3064525 RepID=A0ABT9CIC2_9BACL|nr:DsbA family oxidoreductase [Paenibacillus sp. JX-17]MDO7908620.1 DsbA family oxidoreductase [Paenibacillus sp. JX-17]